MHGPATPGLLRHPIVEDDVVIYSGATILGRITIGRGSTIGGNIGLTRSVPQHSRISQAQVRSEVFGDGSGIGRGARLTGTGAEATVGYGRPPHRHQRAPRRPASSRR